VGIERARVMEIRSGGAGYLLDDRLVLTAGAGAVRPAGTGTWVPASRVWTSPAGAALLELDDPASLMMPAERMSWGRLTGRRPVAVTAMGFPPSPSEWPQDPVRFVGHVAPGDGAVTPATGAGMTGAALFAGAQLVALLLAGGRALPVAALADDPSFLDAVGDMHLVDVATPASAFPILSQRVGRPGLEPGPEA
jgi:hypothetical protein